MKSERKSYKELSNLSVVKVIAMLYFISKVDQKTHLHSGIFQKPDNWLFLYAISIYYMPIKTKSMVYFYCLGMMQGLLSKEVLGPSLEDFVQRLPPYIEENREKLSKEEIERYENQKKLMEEVLVELNNEKDTDSSDVKRDRFTKVLGLMQTVNIAVSLYIVGQ